MPIKNKWAVVVTAAALALGSSAFHLGAVASEKTDAKQNKGKTSEVPAKIVKQISEKFQQARSDLHVIDVSATEVDGIYRVTFDGKGSVYATGSGDFFFASDLYQVQPSGIVNLTEQAGNGPRAAALAAVDRNDMIIFSPKGKVKASVVIFTDVDCGYCQKLHTEVPALNDMGIEVKYMAYPRAGVGSGTYEKMASAWCSSNPQQALTALKSRQEIPVNVCEGNPVADQYALGGRIGLSGTPAIIFESGQLIPGYMPAAKLGEALGL